MAANTNAKGTKGTKNTNAQEGKAMEKKVTKKVEAKKEVAVKKEVEATKVEEKKVVANEEKKDQGFITIQEATKLYAEAGIKCKNPEAKGNYRIMGSGSSLNIKPKKGYFIYTSDEDVELIQEAKLEAKDLIVEKGTNAQDKIRPNTVICTALETLKALLGVYALNAKNIMEVPANK